MGPEGLPAVAAVGRAPPRECDLLGAIPQGVEPPRAVPHLGHDRGEGLRGETSGGEELEGSRELQLRREEPPKLLASRANNAWDILLLQLPEKRQRQVKVLFTMNHQGAALSLELRSDPDQPARQLVVDAQG